MKGAAGLPSPLGNGEYFGSTLAAGDLDGDGADDLAIGDRGVNPNRGAVTVLYGDDPGLSANRVQVWTQDSPGVPSSAVDNEYFGQPLAIAAYGRSSQDDLAIGVWGQNLGSKVDAGMVNVLYGSEPGLTGVGAQGWTQDTPGVRGLSGKRDHFGASLTP